MCGICGATSTELEQRGENFNQHVRVVHNLWSYVYYVYYLHSVSPEDHSSVESVAWKGYSRQTSDWLPRERSSDGEKEQLEAARVCVSREELTEILEQFVTRLNRPVTVS